MWTEEGSCYGCMGGCSDPPPHLSYLWHWHPFHSSHHYGQISTRSPTFGWQNWNEHEMGQLTVILHLNFYLYFGKMSLCAKCDSNLAFFDQGNVFMLKSCWEHLPQILDMSGLPLQGLSIHGTFALDQATLVNKCCYMLSLMFRLYDLYSFYRRWR